MRGIVGLWPTEDGFGFTCDCGTTTLVTIGFYDEQGTPLDARSPGSAVAPQETCVTCDGCGSGHWVTITPPAEAVTAR
jgi:hypothetical protein